VVVVGDNSGCLANPKDWNHSGLARQRSRRPGVDGPCAFPLLGGGGKKSGRNPSLYKGLSKSKAGGARGKNEEVFREKKKLVVTRDRGIRGEEYLTLQQQPLMRRIAFDAIQQIKRYGATLQRKTCAAAEQDHWFKENPEVPASKRVERSQDPFKWPGLSKTAIHGTKEKSIMRTPRRPKRTSRNDRRTQKKNGRPDSKEKKASKRKWGRADLVGKTLGTDGIDRGFTEKPFGEKKGWRRKRTDRPGEKTKEPEGARSYWGANGGKNNQTFERQQEGGSIEDFEKGSLTGGKKKQATKSGHTLSRKKKGVLEEARKGGKEKNGPLQQGQTCTVLETVFRKRKEPSRKDNFNN